MVEVVVDAGGGLLKAAAGAAGVFGVYLALQALLVLLVLVLLVYGLKNKRTSTLCPGTHFVCGVYRNEPLS